MTITKFTFLVILFLIHNFLHGQPSSNWQMQNPTLPECNLKKVFFLNDSLGWIAGDNGTILKTTNGGSLWTIKDFITNQNLNGIHFSDSFHGCVVGKNKTIGLTSDGGETWNLISLNQTIENDNFIGVHFLNASEALIICNADGFEDRGSILRTSDGGATWGLGLETESMYFSDLFFLDSQIGWIAGGSNTQPGQSLMKTTNGGISWQMISLFQFTDILHSVEFYDPLNGYASSILGQVLITSDGGQNWASKIAVVPPLGLEFMKTSISAKGQDQVVLVGINDMIIKKSYDGPEQDYIKIPCGQQQLLNHVYFLGSLTGWAVGQNAILKTLDGGFSWESYSGIGFYAAKSLSFINTQEGWMAGNDGLIAHTADGGQSWKTKPSKTGVNLNGIQFIDQQRGWAVGGSLLTSAKSRILKTNDGGNSWEKLILDSVETLNSIFFINQQKGWVVGSNTIFSSANFIYRTIDGGTSWQLAHAGGLSILNEVYFIDSLMGWVAANDGNVLRTLNGGLTWTVHSTGFSNDLKSIYFTDPIRGWAAGRDGKIIQTTNGGIDWIEQLSGISEDINSIRFLNSEIGFAGGGSLNSGILLKTTNGGSSWFIAIQNVIHQIETVHISPNQDVWIAGESFVMKQGSESNFSSTANIIKSDLNAVSFSDSLHGWAAGSNSVIVQTKNGGKNWLPVFKGPSARTFRDIYFMDSQKGWAVGDSGQFYQTINGGSNWSIVASASNSSFFCIHFASTMRGWVGSNNGQILKTSNGGTSWTPSIIPDLDTILNIHFLDSLNGWIIGGYQSRVFKTTNGGTSWSELFYSGPITRLTKIHFVSPQIGWMAGPEILLTTQNGGNSWTSTTILGISAMSAFHFEDSQNVWVGMANGDIFKSTNGGSSWQDQNSPSTQKINAFSFTNPQFGWAVGGNGSILMGQIFTGTVGVKAIKTDHFSDLHIFPNPTTGKLKIWPDGIFTIKIFNSIGQIIYNSIQSGSEMELDLSHLSPGIYFVRCICNRKYYEQKLVKY
jgi:photosystem II stability/assembly factor-like uncharacterized protein